MKIVEIPSFFTPYGGEFCLEQSKALSAYGNEVTILANVQLAVRRGILPFLSTPYNRRKMKVGGITVYRSDMRGIPLCVRPNVNRWVNIVRSMFRTYVKENGKPDIIHAHCAKWAGYAAYMINKEYDIPFVITEHLSSMIFKKEFGDDISRAWQIPLLKEAYKAADMVVPVSAELVDDIACYFGTDYRWTAISNIIDTDFFAYRERPSLQGRNFRFCCLANFIPLKGYDVLLPAFDMLADKHVEVELHIAGRFTDSKDCGNMVSRLRHKDKVTVHGELSKHDVRDLLYDCDCLVLATRSEAQGLVLLEAMSTGIPAISTTCVPNNAAIEGGTLIVPVDDVEALRDCMERVVSGYVFDGKAISAAVGKSVSPEVIGKQLSDLFTDIVTERFKKQY